MDTNQTNGNESNPARREGISQRRLLLFWLKNPKRNRTWNWLAIAERNTNKKTIEPDPARTLPPRVGFDSFNWCNSCPAVALHSLRHPSQLLTSQNLMHSQTLPRVIANPDKSY
jgi:hypothetical protein